MLSTFSDHLCQRFALSLFNLIYRLLYSCLIRDYAEHHGACEDSTNGRIGPLHLEANDCFVLDHRDASLALRLPLPYRTAERPRRWRWGYVQLRYTVCSGEEQIRPFGFSHTVYAPLSQAAASRPSISDQIPF
jgi:hypothetical protein